MWTRTVGLLIVAAWLSVPAFADSYALVTLEPNIPDTYVTPFATFYGGNYQSSAGQEEIGFNIYIARQTSLRTR